MSLETTTVTPDFETAYVAMVESDRNVRVFEFDLGEGRVFYVTTHSEHAAKRAMIDMIVPEPRKFTFKDAVTKVAQLHVHKRRAKSDDK